MDSAKRDAEEPAIAATAALSYCGAPQPQDGRGAQLSVAFISRAIDRDALMAHREIATLLLLMI